MIPTLRTLLVTTCAIAAAPHPDDSTLAARIAAHVAPAVAAGHLSGALLVARGDEVIVETAYGLANLEHGVANRPDTRFAIASITKEMTFVLAIRMAEARKLSLSDPISKWMPDFPRAESITVLHLLQHRAGIPHRVTTPEQESSPHTAEDMAILAARAQPLPFAPGERSVYSSAGYSVLARVLELAGNAPYGRLLDEYVVRPAGLERTLDAGARQIVADRAESTYVGPDGIEHAPLKDLSFLVGAGSVLSTPRDLFRLQRAIATGKLGKSVLASYLSSGKVNSMRWYGSTNGYFAFADHDGATDLTVVLTANRATGVVDLVREAIPRLAAGEELSPISIPSCDGVAVDVAKELEGTLGGYHDNADKEFVLRVVSGRAFAGDVPLVPKGHGVFFAPFDYGTIEFERDDSGAVDALTWKNEQHALRFERTPGS